MHPESIVAGLLTALSLSYYPMGRARSPSGAFIPITQENPQARDIGRGRTRTFAGSGVLNPSGRWLGDKSPKNDQRGRTWAPYGFLMVLLS